MQCKNDHEEATCDHILHRLFYAREKSGHCEEKQDRISLFSHHNAPTAV